ncbi:MAG: hypothetical protein KAS23_09725, partial [Anaerohalosphaera sp.]|nr:hypothetical protein [Anaerohalosphaera sp.]
EIPEIDNWLEAFRDIQVAIKTAVAGDTIIIAEGTYYENIQFRGHDVEVKAADSTTPDDVVIVGSGIRSVVTFEGTETDECTLTGFTVTTGSTVELDGIISHWQFDSIANGQTPDNVANGNVGAVVDAPEVVRYGKVGNALKFDGSNDYVTADDVCDDIYDGGGDFTFACWIKSDMLGQRQFLSAFNTSTGDNRLLLGQEANDDNLYMHDGNWRDSGAVVFDGNWHHVAYSLDSGSKVTMYVDGENVFSYSCTATIASTDLFSIGQEYDIAIPPAASDFFNGLVDDVVVYGTVLSESEIRHIYEVTESDVEPIAHWSLDSVASSTTADSSGNGHTGTIIGDPEIIPSHLNGFMEFDGIDDCIDVIDSPDDDTLNSGSLTFSTWFKMDLADG